jgi:dipeptidyl aminopeptidase/acylaminoacyl peptidase
MRSRRGAVALAFLALTLALASGAPLRAQAPTPASSPRPSPAAQAPATDIFLVDLTLRGGVLALGRPERVTEHEGYDNQPAFSPDGRSLYFTSRIGDQTDVQRYDLATRQVRAWRQTPESEFSPTPAPGGGLSVVRFEADGTQRLWRLEEGGAAEPLVPDVKPVAYHAWADAETLVLVVLGDPLTLQVADRRSGKADVVARQVGRCVRPVPGRTTVSFVRKVAKGEWWLEALDPKTRATARIGRLPEGVEDYAWLPDGRVLVGQGARLLELPPGATEFRELMRFSERELQNVTRLAANPRGDRLALVADEAKPFPLTVASVMRGPELVGYPPSDLRWSGDSKELFFEWRQPADDEAATYVVPRAAGEPRRLSEEERKLAPSASCEWDKAERRCLAIQGGDVVLVDTVARTRRVLAGSTGSESSPRFALRETAATFVRDNNLFRVALAGDGDVLVQLTDVAPKKKEPKLTDSQQFLKDEERKLLKQVEEAAARRKRAEERKERQAPPRFEIAEGQSVSEALTSGDGRFAFLLVAQKAEGSKTADVPSYVTESAYVEAIPTRTNVGDKQETRRLAVMDLKERESVWAFVDGVTEPEPVKKEEAEEPKKEDAGKTQKREVRWSLPALSPEGTRAVAAVRAADSRDRWLVLLDPASGKGRVLDHQHDDAWVRDPGFPGSGTGFGWVDDRTLWFLSEATGYSHLYTVDAAAETAAPKAVTSGAWEVLEVKLSPRRDAFYLTTSEPDAGERHLYRVAVSGGERTRLTTRPGAHFVEVSPDEAAFADLFSDAANPPEIQLVPARGTGSGRQVTTSTSPAFRSFAWTRPPVVTFTARDGVKVPARLYTPQSLAASPDARRPAVIFIHGAGYLQNAHRYWSTYFREYMFHHVLAARGYVVLDVDYRGSAGYGRDWRTAVAGHMGGKDLDDVVDAAAYLVAEQGVDPKRIGVYGGSYGGFLTLMALFTSPDTFAAGAALRPVTDWAHYNHPYTSSILGQPPRDAEAYRKSSPIYFADGLKGALLICHGMVDTNVHFQDSVRLAQRLIELGKEDWELAAYPVENHGFVEASSWTDEYKRVLALFERTLRGAPTDATAAGNAASAPAASR